jgi:putative spermidine/putrescine transport system ATP-binding protein
VMWNGKIEQIGSPAEMYGNPATPFVAEFIGTMNRLAATVADDGAIDYEGLRLAVDAARGLPQGERVLCLLRPETVDVVVADGADHEGALTGDVVSKIFLGAVTRVRVEDGERSLVADLSTGRAAPLAVGTRVVASFAPSSPRLLALTEDALPPVLDPDNP